MLGTAIVLAVLCLALWAPKGWVDEVVQLLHPDPQDTALAMGRTVLRVLALAAVVVAVWRVKALWVDVVVGFLAVSLVLAALNVVWEVRDALGKEPEGVTLPHEGWAWFDLPKAKVEAPHQPLPASTAVTATVVIPVRNPDGKLLSFDTHVYSGIVRTTIEASGATEDVRISIRRGTDDEQVHCLAADLVAVRTIRLDRTLPNGEPATPAC
jgi:hypothetical protein